MDVQHDNDDGKVSSFWKKSSKPVPGRPSPRKESKPHYNPSTSTSFQDFQQSIDDVWDLGDDEFCSISNIKLSKKGSHAGGNLITIHKPKSSISLTSNLTNSNQRLIRDRGSVSNEGTDKQIMKQKSYKIDIGKQDTPETDAFRNKLKKFENLLNAAFLDLTDLQNLSYPGIPFPVKGETWRILAGYAPPCLEIRRETLQKKRAEYWYYVRSYYETETRDDAYQGTYRQIHIDIPRMSPTIPLFRQKIVQDMFERILFVWAVRHPASGYVQGINDLVTPFFIVFLHQILDQDIDLDTLDLESVDQAKRNLVEADSYWCFCKFLAGIQDNYIFPQLGIQDKISRLRELINRIDVTLHKHLQNNGIEYLQFSFRWMNNLLTRELPLRCLIRLWDTYLAELETFASFQLFVCAAFLLHWKQELMNEKDFQGLMLMLQNLPTQNWDASDINVLVAEAYKLKYTFGGAPNHFQTSGS